MRRFFVVVALAYVGALGWLSWRHPQPELDSSAASGFVPHWPQGFLWGTATAAHQVEGGNTKNDWWQFEHQPGRIAHGDTSGVTAGHWDMVRADIGLMTQLRANAYRFSIEWSRLEPVEGQWDEAAWAHYIDEITQLRSAGIEPVVTLLHFTLPAWIAARGGVLAPDFTARFERFAAEAARRLGPQVRWWCTVNEPNVQMYFGYVTGYWPPGIKDNAKAVQAFAALLKAHAAAARALRAGDPDAFIGLAQNMIWFEPAHRWNLLEVGIASMAANSFNWAFYESIARGRVLYSMPGFPSIDEPAPELAGTIDWLGINYYRRNLVSFKPSAAGMVQIGNGPGPLSDAKVEIFPAGMLGLVRDAWSRYHKPIVITETGLADSTGTRRPLFIRQHAAALQQAIDEGIDVRGSFHWSLMDNFEWAEGYGWRFGLFRLDRTTLTRTAAPGAEEFRRLAPK